MGPSSTKLSVKELLVEEALRQLETTSVEKLSVRVVASACGVSHNTPYRYFKNRQEFLEGLSQKIRLLRQAQVTDRLAETGEKGELFLTVCGELVRYTAEHPQYYALLKTDSPWEFLAYWTVSEDGSLRQETDYREMGKDYLTRCRIPPEEQEDVLFLIGTLLTGTTAMLINGSLRCEGDVGAFVCRFLQGELGLAP